MLIILIDIDPYIVKDLLLVSILFKDYLPYTKLFMALEVCFLSLSKLFFKGMANKVFMCLR